ncbi:MAG: hypothetical protein U1E02_06190, partial [Hydrogenophaga sp.]|nr:hypothetical protein [Hydrogenophaga sp.]
FSVGNSKHLAVGGTVGTGANKKELVKIFKLVGNTLEFIVSYVPDIEGQILSIASFQAGVKKYLAAGGTIGTSPTNAQIVRVLQFGGDVSECVVKNSFVSGTNSLAGDGIGIKADSSWNYVAQNTSCFNNTNYEYVAAAFIASQADAQGVDNVDGNL